MALLPHQQRVVDEKSALDGTLTKLENFLLTGTYMTLSRDEQLRLRRQATYMMLYSNVLGERIAAF